MSPTNKPGTTRGQRPTVDDVVVPDQLSEMASGVDAEALDAQSSSPQPGGKRSWRRVGSVGLLVFGILAGVFVLLHAADVNKKQAELNAAQADQSERIKSQTIGLNSLGLKPINLLTEQANALTVNGQVNVADTLVLDPTAQPASAVSGQLYYDQTRNQLGYYNGGSFVYLQGGNGAVTNNNVSNVSNVNNVSNITNVTNVSNVTNLSGGSGTISGTTGDIAMYTGGNSLGDSLLNQSGTNIVSSATMSIGTANPGVSMLSVAGATSDNTTSALTVRNSSGDTYAEVADDGTVNLGRSPGAVFGNNVVFPTSDTGTAGIISADKFVTTTSTSVVSMSVYVGGVNTYPYDQYQLAIYTDVGGAPGTLVATSGVGLLTGNTWNTLPISATLAGATAYWLAYTADNNVGWADNPYFEATGSPTHAWATFTFGSGSQNGMPTSFPPPSAINAYTHTIYATTLGTGSAFTLNSSGALSTTGPATFKDLNNSTNAFQVQNSTGFSVLDVNTQDNNVGIGTSNPTGARLSVFGASTDNTTKALTVQASDGTSLAQITDDGSVGLGESRAVFGNNSSGNFTGNGYYNSGFALMQSQSFTTSAGGAINSLSTYIGQPISSTNNLYQMGIYSDFNGRPNTYLASTNVGTLTNTGWNTLPITYTLAANTKYWLVYWTNTNDGNHNGQNFISGYSGPNTFYQTFETWQSGASNGMPTTMQSGNGIGTSYETSIYATYAAPSSALLLDSLGNLTEMGSALIQNSSNTALQVADSGGGEALLVDSINKQVAINSATSNGFTLGVSGTTGIDTNSTKALQVGLGPTYSLFTADTTDNQIILGNDGTPYNLTVRGGAATGNNVTGGNITFDASNGTGAGGSGSFIFRTAKPSGNAIAVDSTGNMSVGSTNTATLSFTTGSQPNRLLVVTVITAGATYTSVTYDGLALTQLATKNNTVQVEMWYLVNPPTGTHNIVTTKTNNNGNLIGATDFYNVDQSNPFGTAVTNSGSTAGSQLTALNVPTTSTSQVVVDGIGTDSADPFNTAGQTQLWNQPPNAGNWPAAAAYAPGTGGTVNMSWTVNSSDWADIGVPLNPVTNTSQDSLSDTLTISNNGNVGIGTANAQQALQISGGSMALDSGQSIFLNGAADGAWTIGRQGFPTEANLLTTAATVFTVQNTATEGLMVRNAANQSVFEVSGLGQALFKTVTNNALGFQIQNSNGDPLFVADTSGMNITIAGTTSQFGTLTVTNAHFVSTQTTKPTISTPINCGASPTATVTAGATDSAGSFTINTGSGSGSTCDTTVTFNKPYASAPKAIILTPTIAVGGATVSSDARVSAETANSFTIQVDTATATTTYSYYYWVVQ